jgi:sugar lactone lactonase YvrE
LKRLLLVALLSGCYDLDQLSAGFDLSAASDGMVDLGSGLSSVSLLAGGLGGAGAVNGTGAAARFNQPISLAYDSGALFVAEWGNCAVRKVDIATQQVTTFAGQLNVCGIADGPAASALFTRPTALALDGSDLWVADGGASRIRKVSAGEVTSVIGSVVSYGLAVVGGTLYYTSTSQNQILQLSLAADASATPTVFSGKGTAGFKSGTPLTAQYSAPEGIAPYPGGGFVVADQSNNALRIVDAAGNVSVLAPPIPHPSTTTAASPFYGLAIDGSGNAYVANATRHEIEKFTAPLSASIGLIGVPGTNGSTDGSDGVAEFYSPSGAAFDGDHTLYVADRNNHTIRAVDLTAVTASTFAGTPPHSGNADATGANARFAGPIGVTWDATQRLFYVADYSNHRLRTVDPSGAVATVLVSQGSDASTLATVDPAAVVPDGAGNLYYLDYAGDAIYKIDSTGRQTVLAGNPGVSGLTDGTGMAASFNNPRDLAFDSRRGLFYVADQSNGRIRTVTLAGVVTSYAATFKAPTHVAYDPDADVLYIAETSNHAIHKFSFSNNTITVVAGIVGQSGHADGATATATFNQPRGLALDGAGALFVADYGNSTVRRIDLAAAQVTTIAGVPGQAAATLGPLPATLNFPEGLAWAPGIGLVVSMPIENSLVVIR